VENFTAQSKKLMPPIAWRSLQKAADAFSNPDKAAAERLLNQTKQALAAGHRVLIGVVLDTKQGVGALGTYNKVKGDSWILTPEILQDLKNEDNLAGHEMVVTGYDDTAIVVGPNNKKEKGVFKLRNSWSSDAGDNGNYYMTYSYYKLLVDEVDEVLDHS
jgi:aminopeptidase C